jgi:hypothetical protein
MTIKTHKLSGWTRKAEGHGEWRITPTDGSGDRIVHFLSAGSWQNLENDDRANINRDRVILCAGAELPDWAAKWLDDANHASCQSGRNALRAAMYDADWHADSRDGW